MTWPPQPNPYGTPQVQPQWAANQWGQPPGWGPPPPQRRRSRWWLALPAGLAVVVFVGCGSLLVRGGAELNGATKSANEYAKAIVAGNNADAYEMHCAADCDQMSLEQFGEAHQDEYTAYRIENLRLQNFNGVSSGDLRLSFTRANATIEHVYVPLRHENGQWKPCDNI